ncbi:hypothetical protein [Maricaulis maris]|uniref:Uncharacterized protein n=1 Tax=Maricaulis maris TaxID=74318 RepID=A0A495D383_9PROT|nr:hypothetical protein [Maricaulis maris]RKQ95430.1 hypothetical protein C7435_2532 [Maricaulis maris]
MPRPLEEIDADIATFQAAYDKLLLGTRPQGLKHGDREIQFGSNFSATEKALKQRLHTLTVERARLTGDPLPHRPYSPRGMVG